MGTAALGELELEARLVWLWKVAGFVSSSGM